MGKSVKEVFETISELESLNSEKLHKIQEEVESMIVKEREICAADKDSAIIKINKELKVFVEKYEKEIKDDSKKQIDKVDKEVEVFKTSIKGKDKEAIEYLKKKFFSK